MIGHKSRRVRGALVYLDGGRESEYSSDADSTRVCWGESNASEEKKNRWVSWSDIIQSRSMIKPLCPGCS